MHGRTAWMIKNYMKILLKKRDLKEDNKKLFKDEASNDIDIDYFKLIFSNMKIKITLNHEI